MTKTTTSNKVLRVWTDDYKVGIWENCTQSVKLYADRAIVKTHYVKWVNNSGSLAQYTERWTGKALEKLLEIARQETTDGEDYTDRVMQFVDDTNYY